MDVFRHDVGFVLFLLGFGVPDGLYGKGGRKLRKFRGTLCVHRLPYLIHPHNFHASLLMQVQIGETIVRLVQGDLTDAQVDAVVNAANSSLFGGGGVDGAIHRRGGPSILEACKRIRQTEYPNRLPTGEAVLTTGGDLPAQHVIHTVGPVWRGGDRDEVPLLANAYLNSLKAARSSEIRTVAFPSISTGAFRFPIQKAASIALNTVIEVIREYPKVYDEIRFVLFSSADFAVYQKALNSILNGDLPDEH